MIQGQAFLGGNSIRIYVISKEKSPESGNKSVFIVTLQQKNWEVYIEFKPEVHRLGERKITASSKSLVWVGVYLIFHVPLISPLIHPVRLGKT